MQNDAYTKVASSNGFGATGAYDTEEIPGASPVAERNRAGFAAGMGNFTLSSQSLPFAEGELMEMLSKVRTAKQKKGISPQGDIGA